MPRNRFVLSARACAALAVSLPAMVVMMPATAHAQLSIGLDIRIGYAPPPLPVYEQPPLPAPDYIWVPGHWAWSDWIDDYYWVRGYWEQPPQVGLLWTPAYWGWDNGAFLFHGGYWGREVGWYGGIDYGHGYGGHGWDGGRWQDGHLAYNSAAVNITNVHVTNVYYQKTTVINNYGRTSYSGGAGGVQARPNPQEVQATRAPHIAPTPAQQAHVAEAAKNPANVASKITPSWHPPAVHRVTPTGAPIPRTVALQHGGATAGAPPQFQHPAAAGAAGAAGAGRPAERPAAAPMAPARTEVRPAYEAPRVAPTTAYTPRAEPTAAVREAPRAAPAYQAPRPAPTQSYVPPRPAPTQAYAPAPRPAPVPQYHAPAPQPQYHAAPPPRPAPPPKPAPKAEPHEHEHQR